MKLATREAIAAGGQVKLVEPAILPGDAMLDVVVTGVEGSTRARMMSPRLMDRGCAADFVMEVTGDRPDAGVSRNSDPRAGR